MSSTTLPTLAAQTPAKSPASSVRAGDSPSDKEREAARVPSPTAPPALHVHPLAELSQGRKHLLLFIFAIASFVDVCNVSGVAVAGAQIAFDIKLAVSQIVWIITAYSLTFASFLLFAGRLSDLFPAHLVFEFGFVGLGILSLVQSFVTHNKYGFLIVRGLGGVMGALTIPSGYHLTVHMFPDAEEQPKKLALLGIAGALGNVLGLVLAGLTMLASYHWFFRVIAIICLVFAIATFFLLPASPADYDPADGPRWKRLDLLGVLFMSGALLCFILGLTQGPIDGWGKASFIAPFVISIFLAVGFFLLEARIHPRSAVLPATVWKIKNMKVASIVTLLPFSFWATSQLLYATYWQVAFGWKPLHVAAAVLPQGIAALIVGMVVQFVPAIINTPRITIPVGSVLVMTSEVLMYYSDGGSGMNYWKYCFPAFVIGSVGAISVFMASGINLIAYCPPEMGGVAGAWTQVLAQVGGAIALGVQAGLEGTALADWKHNARSFWFEFAAFALIAVVYAIFYTEPAGALEEHRLTRERIAELEEKFAQKEAGSLPAA
ncbi:hypothetical protein Q8F55_002509 [Vanrija albida]|uniref:Major facilitator superfamily (MFS) profile domain-containing protein n=1 Tax=Vanrija albida TaxID=181172 RepID=A0ABR3QAI6_9TREE